MPVSVTKQKLTMVQTTKSSQHCKGQQEHCSWLGDILLSQARGCYSYLSDLNPSDVLRDVGNNNYHPEPTVCNLLTLSVCMCLCARPYSVICDHGGSRLAFQSYVIHTFVVGAILSTEKVTIVTP